RASAAAPARGRDVMLLSLAFAFALDRRLELVRESLTGTHCRYRQYVDGLPTDDYVTTPCTVERRPPSAADSRENPAAEAAAAPLRRAGPRIPHRVIHGHPL